MKRTSSVVTIIGGFLLLSACGGGGGGGADLADTPEGRAFLYRQSVMRVIANKMATIGGMAREEIPLDEAVFAKATSDAAALAGMILEGFEPEGLVAQSRTLPETWTDWEDFQQRAQDLEQATTALAEAAESGGFEAARGLVQSTAGNCGACHRVYRAPEEE